MSHVPHILHWMFHETKLGGGVAIAAIVVTALIVFNANSVMKPADACLNSEFPTSSVAPSSQPCPEVFDEETFVANLLFCLAGGAIGVGIAGVAVELGVSKETLGIDE